MELKKFNYLLLIIPIFISLLGVLTLLSTAKNLAKSHVIFLALGLVIYFGTAFFDYLIFKFHWKYMYFFVLILLILTFIGGVEKLGAVRWLNFKEFSIQPSEYAKAVVIISSAALISKSKDSLKGIKNLLLLAVPFFSLIIFVLVQPDLGTTIVIFLVFAGILFYAGLDWFYFAFVTVLFGIFSNPVWNLLKDYQKNRILVFLNPSLDKLGFGYNVIQSTIAIGSGMLFGMGFGRGTQTHLQFLPVYWTDFIFAAFAEEWGFIGVFGIISLYVILLFLLIKLSLKVKDTFGSLIIFGVFMMFFSQFLVNVGMNLGLMPVTGIPLPLVSYGGNSLIVSMFLLGLVQSVVIRNS